VKPGDYPYPPDEFDAAAEAGGPRGVHRATRSRWSRWWPFVVVLVVFPALAYAAVTILSDWDGLGGSDSASEQPGQGTDEPSETPEPTDPAATPEPEPTETEEPPPPPPPPPPPLDLARAVDVYNSTGRSGLAGNAAERLEEIGFTDVSALNWNGERPAVSIVYYGVETDVTTAQQVATTLGIAQVVLDPAQATEGIVVVLADDYVVV
jgi:hypothetical protein